MFNFNVNFRTDTKTPLYEQLYRYIKEEIHSARVSEGEKLPSKKALAGHLKISVNTVDTAYSILVQEGYLTSRPRSGYYVNHVDFTPHTPPDLAPPPKERRFAADFGTNTADLGAFPSATWIKLSKEVMYNEPELLRAGDFRGDYELRLAIAKYLYEARSVICEPEQVVVGAGIEYLLMLLVQLLPPERAFAAEDPGYMKIRAVLSGLGRELNYVPLDGEGLSAAALSKTNSDIVYVTPSHQFPTGRIMSARRRGELLDWAYSRDGRYIIEDDYDCAPTYSVKPLPSIQSRRDHRRVIYLNNFSRTLAPSIRISYMILPPELVKPFGERFGGFSSTVPRFEQHTLERFISGGYLERHLNRTKQLYKKKRDMLIDTLTSVGGDFEIAGESAGTHLTVKTKYAPKILSEAKSRAIRVYDLNSYYSAPETASDTLVIGYASCSESDLALLRTLLSDAANG